MGVFKKVCPQPTLCCHTPSTPSQGKTSVTISGPTIYSRCVGYLLPIQVIHILISLYSLLRRYAKGNIAS